ncbi:MAG: 2-keto-4-pentenoate hydratase/2-oxohepta-3-ene-1,7-dioic acid hydratase in catechol pathway [Myxococcota bacterium]|jgi:2-keto-4-pentenoate hydratase/2-oxohepta-3-ene-1,7-dioic acid hydratase in catechol pathway
MSGSPYDGTLAKTDNLVSAEVVHALPPSQPSKIVCIGSNYRAHCEEMGRDVPSVPKLFLKPPSALVADGGTIELPPDVGRVDFEGELAIVIGRKTRRIAASDVAEHILGYTVLNDVTARQIQRSDVQFTRAKGFDTFCPAGPWIETELNAHADPNDLYLRTRVNGEMKQDSRTSDMVFGPSELVSFISHVMTLEPGDIVSTGTPSGVGPLSIGDLVSIEIEGIGRLENRVVSQ